MKVLLFDDHKLFSQSFKMFLEEYFDFEKIMACNTLEEAENILSKNDIDLLFIDFVMPKINVFQLLEKWKKQHEAMKIVVLSSITDSGSIANLLSNHADGFLSKSVSENEIKDCLHQISINKKYISKEYQLDVMDALLSKENSLFTQRELEIIELIKQGKSIKEKASLLFLSENTIIVHRRNIMKKANVTSVATLVAKLKDFNL